MLQLVWVVTFFAVLILGIIYGLAVGVVFALLAMVVKSSWYDWGVPFPVTWIAVHTMKIFFVCRPRSFHVQKMDYSNKFHEEGTYIGLSDIPNARIFRLAGPLNCANSEYIKSSIFK